MKMNQIVAEFSTPEFTSSPKDRKTQEHMNSAQRLTFRRRPTQGRCENRCFWGDEDTNSFDDHGNQEGRSFCCHRICICVSVVSEGEDDDNKRR